MPIGPPGEFETDIDRIIREAMESGEFDDLAGTGEPISGAGTKDDPLWWVRGWVKRNHVESGQKPSGGTDSTFFQRLKFVGVAG